jgi:hypothetical protein
LAFAVALGGIYALVVLPILAVGFVHDGFQRISSNREGPPATATPQPSPEASIPARLRVLTLVVQAWVVLAVVWTLSAFPLSDRMGWWAQDPNDRALEYLRRRGSRASTRPRTRST